MRDKILKEIVNPDCIKKYLTYKYYYEFKAPVTKTYKISICTTCMNRADDIKKTYIKNIEDNFDYQKDQLSNVEFVLLNYNSKDDLDDWVRKNLMGYIKAGFVNYYHTTEPQHYSMTHSRNVAFKLATGDIVNNVDGDHFTNRGFAKKINFLANQKHKHTVFVKSRQKNRGRLGFFKKEFMWLRGYNEAIEGYGFDDEDLLARAFHAGFHLMKFGGEYMRITDDHRRHVMKNYKNQDWRYTQRLNTLISLLNLSYKRYQTNKDIEWGKATVIKNFKERIKI